MWKSLVSQTPDQGREAVYLISVTVGRIIYAGANHSGKQIDGRGWAGEMVSVSVNYLISG